MKKLITLSLLLSSLMSFSQANTDDDFSVSIKFDKSINIDSLTVFFYETNGQKFNSINYNLDKSNNSITIFGNNEYMIGTKFPTLVFSYSTMETKSYLCQDSLKKNSRLPCTETIENTQLFYLISDLHVGSYSEIIPTEIKFTNEINSILISKDVQKGYTVITAKNNELSHGYRFKEMIFISNKITKINKK